jgi:nucleoside-diphosphate-sugar epimerase
MRVAVTGACGFIGRHLLAEISKHPVDVVAMVQNSSQLSQLDSRIKSVVIDIAAPPSDTFEALGRPDVLVHLAWGGLPNYLSLAHFETELPQQYRFLKGLVEAGLPAMLVAGTCFEYGAQSGPLFEKMQSLPGNPYGYAKDALRRQLAFLREKHSYALTWARLFYMYGEGQAKNSLWRQLKRAVERGDKVFNMSGGDQLRDYLSVTDVASSLVTLAVAQTDAGVVNVCSGKPISVRNLVEGWIQENGWIIDLNLGHYPYPDYEPMAFWGCRDKLDAILEAK